MRGFDANRKRREVLLPSCLGVVDRGGLADVKTMEAVHQLSGELAKATVREATSFRIETFLPNGQRVATGGETFFVSIRGVAPVRARLTDNEDGTYTINWKAPQSGTYHVTVSKFGIPLKGCPFTILATTPEPSPLTSSVSGDGLRMAHSQRTHTFDVCFKDGLGAVTHAVELDVFVETVPLGSPRTVAAAAAAPAPAASAISGSASFKRTTRRTEGASNADAKGVALTSIAEDTEAWSPPAAVLSPEPTPFVLSPPVPVSSPETQRATKKRRIRVKIGSTPLVVRAGLDLDSERIGQLLPGAIVTVIEERVTPGHVRACVALDHMDKETPSGMKSTKGATFLGQPSSTYRPQMTDRTKARATPATSRSNVASPDKGLQLSFRTSAGNGRFGASPMGAGTNGSRTPQSSIRERVFDGTHRPGGDSVLGRARALNAKGSTSDARIASRLAQISMPRGAIAADLAAAETPSASAPAADMLAPAGAPAPAPAPSGSAVGGHAAVKKRFGMKLSTSVAVTEAAELSARLKEEAMQLEAAPVPADQTAPGNYFVPDDASSFRAMPVTSGWVTLMKDGVKLVSSRLRLDSTTRQQYQRQWERRAAADSSKASRAAAVELLNLTPAEQELDAAAFAFGGVFPGTLHAHGKLHETHRASYSIGIAGVYLLHVRLRKQAASLPGSPFMLTVHPGPAYAAQTELPLHVRGEVGGLCSIVIRTGDQMGNACVQGGAKIVAYCGDKDPSKNKGEAYGTSNDKVKAELEAKAKAAAGKAGATALPTDVEIEVPGGVEVTCTDQEDGSYLLTFNGRRTGLFSANVKIDGRHVTNSPTKLFLSSSKPDVAKSVVSGEGIRQVVKAEPGTFWIDFFDVYGNPTRQDEQFRKDFKDQIRMRLTSPGTSSNNSSEPAHQYDGAWKDEPGSHGHGKYMMTYTPSTSGAFSLHVYLESPSGREPLPGSPFNLNVHANSSDQVVDVAVVDASGITSGDYKIVRSTFEDAQKRWTECTIDAFASAATALLPRFWTQKQMGGSEGTDAFKQKWGEGEVIWAHPPPERMDQLVKLLARKDRLAEVIVCAPFRPTTSWSVMCPPSQTPFPTIHRSKTAPTNLPQVLQSHQDGRRDVEDDGRQADQGRRRRARPRFELAHHALPHRRASQHHHAAHAPARRDDWCARSALEPRMVYEWRVAGERKESRGRQASGHEAARRRPHRPQHSPLDREGQAQTEDCGGRSRAHGRAHESCARACTRDRRARNRRARARVRNRRARARACGSGSGAAGTRASSPNLSSRTSPRRPGLIRSLAFSHSTRSGPRG